MEKEEEPVLLYMHPDSEAEALQQLYRTLGFT